MRLRRKLRGRGQCHAGFKPGCPTEGGAGGAKGFAGWVVGGPLGGTTAGKATVGSLVSLAVMASAVPETTTQLLADRRQL